MTEPEQWAVELWNRAADAADGCATQSFGDDAKAAALTIQRAFEERERKLRDEISYLEGRIEGQKIAHQAIKQRNGSCEICGSPIRGGAPHMPECPLYKPEATHD